MDSSTLNMALKCPDEGERLTAVNGALEMGKNPYIATMLVKHLSLEPSQVVREGIVFALQHMICREAYPALFVLFGEDDAYLRNAAMSIFGQGDDSTIAFLVEQIPFADREVRKLILDSMVQIGTPFAAQNIRTALYDPAPNVRITAADYLGRLADVESVDVMLEMFCNDKEPMLRTTILESVTSMRIPEVTRKLIAFQEYMTFDPMDEILFLPILLRFAGRVGDIPYLAGLLARIRSLPVYAEDVIQAFQNITLHDTAAPHLVVLFAALRGIALDTTIREDLRFSAIATLLRLGNPLAVKDCAAFTATFKEQDFREEIGNLCVNSDE